MAMEFKLCDPEHDDAQKVISRLSDALLEIIGDDGKSSFDKEDVRQPRSVFVVGYDSNKPVACGALRPISEEIVELKRTYSENGSGETVLIDLEKRALGLGYSIIWLSTRVANVRAVQFYEKHGYQRIRNYGKYAGRDNSICFEKCLV